MDISLLKSSILIVDDSDYIKAITSTLLKREGFVNIYVASDGISALEKFKELNPDLVILDIMLPKMNGFDVLVEIKKLNPQAKVIVISSLATIDNIQQAKNAGAAYYLVKPFDNQYFIKTVKELLTTKGKE